MLREYDIVAFPIPVVYTPEGDYDPNGMVFVPAAVAPLLQWCRERWEEGGERLPRLHHRRQRARLVIDGLERLDAMIGRLHDGTSEDQALLARLVAKETRPLQDDCDHYDCDPHHDRDDHRRYHETNRDRAVRMNVERQIAELQIALADLQRTTGPTPWDATDARNDPIDLRGLQGTLAGVPDPAGELPPRLVSLSPHQRTAMRAHWIEQERLIDTAIAEWFVQNDTTAANVDLAARGAWLPDGWLARLVFNDHVASTRGPFDRFNPVKPIPLLRPLVLRACVGDTLKIHLHNTLSARSIDWFVQGHAMHGGAVSAGLCQSGGSVTADFDVDAEGVWPINDIADLRGNEDGTNTHGLFGALIVEPPGARWFDPQTGFDLTDHGWASLLDVMLKPDEPTADLPAYLDYETTGAPG